MKTSQNSGVCGFDVLQGLGAWLVRGLTVVTLVLTCPQFVFGQNGKSVDGSYDSGQYLYRAGDCVSAIPALKAAVPSNLSANLQLGACYLETKAFAEAESALLIYLQQFPSDLKAVKLLASTFKESRRNPDALELLQRYVSRNPEDLGGETELGRLYLDAGDKEKAAAAFGAVLAKSPEYPAALLGAGLIAIADGRLQEAVDFLSKASRLAPGAPDSFRALGDVYAKQGKCESAIPPYNRAFELRPSDFSTAKGLAKCYLALNRLEGVRRVLRSSTLEEAKDTEATDMAAKALASDPQGLEEYLRGVIELNPGNTVARSRWAQSLMASHNIQAAKREYIEISKLEKEHPDPDICFKLAAIYEGEGDVQNAHRYYDLAANSAAATPEMHLALARTDLATDDLGGAQAELGKITGPASERAEYRVLQVEINMRSGNWDAANATVAEMLAQDANNLKLLDLAAQIALKQERYAEQAGFLERLYQAAPTNKDVLYRLTRVYVLRPELKRDDRVADLLKDFAARQETDPEGYLILAYFYQRNNDARNAKIFYDLGFSHVPNPVPAGFAWAYSGYANFLGTAGNWEDALVSEKQAVQLLPSDDASLYNLGLIYAHLGKTDDLEQVIDRLRDINPDFALKLQEQLRRLGRKPRPGA